MGSMMKREQGRSGLVYSTDGGTMCPACRLPVVQCACRLRGSAAVGSGKVRVVLERTGRAGKGVTLVRGLPLDMPALMLLGKQLRTACGCGGTVKDGVIEVQGDHRDRVVDWLIGQGWEASRGNS